MKKRISLNQLEMIIFVEIINEYREMKKKYVNISQKQLHDMMYTYIIFHCDDGYDDMYIKMKDAIDIYRR